MREVKAGRGRQSVKWSFLFYIPVSAIVAYAGAFVIGVGINYLQDSDWNLFPHIMSGEEWFWLVGCVQFVLIPLWVIFVFTMTGILFYKRELEEPVKLLMDASAKISDNCLDFSIVCHKKNELGMLCQSFEKMRDALYRNNQEMWRMLEERKNVNTAFSHDMRTPITVLKGYRDLLENYIPGGEVRVCGVPVERAGQVRGMIGYLPQDFSLRNDQAHIL